MTIDAARTGAENMARDEAALNAGRPWVRLYRWRPACVSLGRSQTRQVVDPQVAAEQGVDIVRRPTGGGALLHDEHELTYGIVVPTSAVAVSIHQSYRVLAEGVRLGLGRLGVRAQFIEGRGGDADLCYLREEGVSLAVDGRKISGGAQRRTHLAVLQHGTILVTRDAQRTARLLGGDAAAIGRRTTSLQELGADTRWDHVAQAVAAGFEQAWPHVPTLA